MHMPPHAALGSDRSALAGKRFERQTIRRAWGFAQPYRRQIAGFLATIVVAALLALVPPFLFGAIIDRALPGGDHAPPNGDRGLLWTLAAISVAAALSDGLLSIAQRWWSARIGEGLIYELRTALYGHVQRLPIAFFTRTQTGALISRLNNDVVGAQSAVTGTLGSVVSNAIVLVTTLVAMATRSWQLTLLALTVLPVFVLPAKRVGRRLQAISREQMNLNASLNTQMTERFNVSGALLVKLFGRAADEEESFRSRAGRVRDIGVRSAMYGRIFFVGLSLAAAVGVAAIYGVGGQFVIDGALTTGELVTLAALVGRIYQPLTSLTNARVDLMTTLVSFERVFELLDTPVDVAEKPGAYDLSTPNGALRGRVELDHVRFTYPSGSLVASLEPQVNAPSDEVLHDVSFIAEPGQLVAVVGPSGAGKSTITSLIPRLYDVSSGAVRIDGHDVRDLTHESLRRAIGVVVQDPHLFHESIADNLRYAKPDATPAEMEAACRAAQIHDVIAALPDGYDTIVGDRGYRLSGGEKQRVAIARVLLKDPAIVILDEATSHLDAENELLVQRALDEALSGRTAVVVAHRLSTIRDADLIVVVDGGRIVERGTHGDLMEARGLYADLYDTLVGAATL
jgi:ATP-binding cassette, subfamily B, bacterial